MNNKVVLIGLVVLVLLLILRTMVTKENLVPIQDEVTDKRGFLPSHQGPYFQNLPPTLDMENTYHTLIHDDCNGDYSNLECRQKAYIKTVKGNSTDKADLICDQYRNDEDRYYKCLDGVYGNYIWMDRFTGVSPCRCNSPQLPDRGQGALASDGSCYCGKNRPLKQRYGYDQNGIVIDRLNGEAIPEVGDKEECVSTCWEMYAKPIFDNCQRGTKSDKDYKQCLDKANIAPLNACYASCK